MLRATYNIEANVAKVLFKFEVDKNLKAKLLTSENRNQHALKAVKEPSFEQIQIKINFPNEVNDVALMCTHGSFKFSLSEEAGNGSGLWTMPQGPSITESNGIATLEGKLKIGNFDQTSDGGILSGG